MWRQMIKCKGIYDMHCGGERCALDGCLFSEYLMTTDSSGSAQLRDNGNH